MASLPYKLSMLSRLACERDFFKLSYHFNSNHLVSQLIKIATHLY